MGFKISKKLADKRYREGRPILSDERYDQLFGSDASDMDTPSLANKVKHTHFMASLAKLTCVDENGELDIGPIIRNLGGTVLVATWKYDGLAVELKYRNGCFVRAITRGDGNRGEDVTENVRKMKNFLPSLNYNLSSHYHHLSIKAEIVMYHSDYNRYLATTKDKNPYSNPRNGASGATRSRSGENCRFCTIKYYGIGDGYWGTEQETFGALCELGVVSPDEYICCFADPERAKQSNAPSLPDIYNRLLAVRKDIGFDVDGIVVCVNSNARKRELGVDARQRPKYKLAIKFPHTVKDTLLRDIEWSIGMGSHITPVAVFDEVDLGVNVTRASLSNLDSIRKIWGNGFPRVGDVIRVSRRGDVIPKVECLVTACETGRELVAPSVCDACGEPTYGDGPFLVCRNPECDARRLGDILKWIDELKTYFRFAGIGPETIEKLYEAGLVRDICDLYRINATSVTKALDIRGSGEEPSKLAQNALAYQEFKEVPLATFLGALNIQDIGTSIWAMLIKNTPYNTLEMILSPSFLSRAWEVEGIGDKRKMLMCDGIERWRGTIAELLELGITVVPYIPAVKIDTPISGKSFCITGGLSRERPAFEAYIQSLGGVPKSGVSKKLDYLIVGDLPGATKLDKAEKYGIKTITEIEFNRLVGCTGA